jgi:predicted transcriptional regulator
MPSRQFQVSHYMTSNPVYVPYSVSFPDAIDIMIDKGIGQLVIAKSDCPLAF